jgi:tripartite motif-containing protein 71
MAPEGIAVDPFGNIFVSDTTNNNIQKFTSDGKFITSWGSEGDGQGQLNSPAGIDVDSSGNLYVTDDGNSRIEKFTNNGDFVTMWGLKDPAMGN